LDVDIKMAKASELTEDQSKAQLEELQKKYSTLIVTFNNQQTELAGCQAKCSKLEAENKDLQSQLSGDKPKGDDAKVVEDLRLEIKALEASNMALQKKVNKLQVEHVSEEEVDQLFYALEKKEEQLAAAQSEKEKLSTELNSARGNPQTTFIEIHHHNDISDNSDDDDDHGKGAAAPVS